MAGIDQTRLELASLLLDLECSLRSLQLWSAEQPSDEALASVEPFACDRLFFNEWLQFIFIPRLQQIIDEDLALPTTCGISPMAEEYLRVNGMQADTLLKQLRLIDRLITEND